MTRFNAALARIRFGGRDQRTRRFDSVGVSLHRTASVEAIVRCQHDKHHIAASGET